MKADIHPKVQETTFTCSCGESIQTMSVLGGKQTVEICSNCHPFFKGKGAKVLDTAGRIEKFNKRYNRK